MKINVWVCHAIPFCISLLVLLMSGCNSSSSDVEDYDSCILEYIKPSMTLEATDAVRNSCARKFPENAPAPTTPQKPLAQITQENREACFEKARSSSHEIQGKMWAKIGCNAPSETLSDIQVERCNYAADLAEKSRKQDEIRCSQLYP